MSSRRTEPYDVAASRCAIERDAGPFRIGLARYVRARLHRRIFMWFGASIVLTAGTVWMALSLMVPDEAYREDWERFRGYVGERFADAWDDPAARDRLARETANDLRVDVRLFDERGAELAAFGERPCERPRLTTEVRRDRGPARGEVWICVNPEHHGPASWVLFSLLLAAAMIWALTGVAARRLAGPIWEMALVARDIGAGKTGARARLPGHHHVGELGVLAESINDMASRIEKQLRDQRELLAAVSHELRTPLGHMRVILETMRDKTSLSAKDLEGLEREVLEVDDLVGELLANSRLQFDTLSFTKLEGLDVAANALERVGLPLELLASEEESIPFEGDATLLGRALTNLLENAKRHGGGVTKLVVDATDDEIVFVVEDAGPGFGPEELEKVFASFYRGEHRAGASHGSLGLGLSLVRRIAAAHGGRAWAENRDGRGAKVGIRIARRRGPSGDAPSARPAT
jgi:signal transduction histidine kinase